MECPDAELRTQGVFSLAPHMAVKYMDVKHMNANSFPFS